MYVKLYEQEVVDRGSKGDSSWPVDIPLATFITKSYWRST